MKLTDIISFNRPYHASREREYVAQALASSSRQGGGPFTRSCVDLLKSELNGESVCLTQSCTDALELAAILSNVGPGDEVIMPSFTFVSTANAFVLRGATPVFVDIDPTTQNMDPRAAEAAITARTRAIVLVHYGGIACDVAAFRTLAKHANAFLIEDAAQAYGAKWNDHPLGTVSDLAAISFHDTKNVSSGEGGAFVSSDPEIARRARVVWEKGTNRTAFLQGEVDKYTWVDVGSSFLPSEITAAMLLAHLEEASKIMELRRAIWHRYDRNLAGPIADKYSGIQTPACPSWAEHNGHLYYIVLPSAKARDQFIAAMVEEGISTVFHYVPLHSSPAGRKFGKVVGEMTHTDRAGSCLVRLPLFADLDSQSVDRISDATLKTIKRIGANI